MSHDDVTAMIDPSQWPFGGLKVCEFSSGIAAAYCGKMFADAGADVVKVEPATATRCGSGAPKPDSGAGALFGYSRRASVRSSARRLRLRSRPCSPRPI